MRPTAAIAQNRRKCYADNDAFHDPKLPKRGLATPGVVARRRRFVPLGPLERPSQNDQAGRSRGCGCRVTRDRRKCQHQSGEELITMTKARRQQARTRRAQTRHQGHRRRPQSARAPRLRQHAGLSRLHAALSHRRGLSRPRGPVSLRPPRHADLGGAGKRHPGDRRTGLRRGGAPALRALPRSPPRCFRCCESGDHVLVTDSAYGPTRTFCDTHAHAAAASPRPTTIR